MSEQEPPGSGSGEGGLTPSSPAAAEATSTSVAGARDDTDTDSADAPRVHPMGGTSVPGAGDAAPRAPAEADVDEAEPIRGRASTPSARARFVWIALDRDGLTRVEEALAALRDDAEPAPQSESPVSEPAGSAESALGSTEAPSSAADDTGADPVGPADPAGHATPAAPAVASADTPRGGVVEAHDGEGGGDAAREVAGGREVAPRGGLVATDAPGRDDARVTTGGSHTGMLAPSASVDDTAASLASVQAPTDEQGRADLAIFPFFTDERPLSGMLGLFDWRAAGRFTRLVDAEGEPAGEVGHALLTLGGATLPARRVVLLGLGATTSFDEAAAETAAARIGDVVRDLRPHSVVFGVSTAATSRDALDAFLRRLVAAAEDTPVVWLVCVEPRALARLRRRLGIDAEP